jgi:hypothetical protein
VDRESESIIEDEILKSLGPGLATAFLERLEQLPLGYLVQDPDESALHALKSLSQEGPVLLCGAPTRLIHALPADLVLAHSHNAERALRREFPERRVQRALGIDLPFPERTFRVAIATDFVRALPLSLANKVLAELSRVAECVFLLVGLRDTRHSRALGRAPFRDACGWEFHDLAALEGVLATTGAGLEHRHSAIHTGVFQLVSCNQQARSQISQSLG